MAVTKYTCPPQTAAGSGTFSNNLVGFQLVQGGGFTQGNFEFTTSVTEKSNRTFETGVFSNPISLESLNTTIEQSRSILSNNFQVFPNIDLSEVTSFTLYGPLNKRLSSSVEHIVNYFPAALEISKNRPDFTSGVTANNIIFDPNDNVTEFEIDIESISNPFNIDFTTNATVNLSSREIKVSDLRNLTVEYPNYILVINGENYPINNITPSSNLTAGTLTVFVEGNPFDNNPISYDYLIIRPNDDVVNRVFNLELDYVDKFILDRSTTPIYTSQFTVPLESDNGTVYNSTDKVTWPLFGEWNLDILTDSFTVYLEKLNEIAENFDSYKTNLIARFLVTDSLVEFDTQDQKVDKVLKHVGQLRLDD